MTTQYVYETPFNTIKSFLGWMILNSIQIVVFSQPGLGARKSGLAEAVNRPKLTFVVSPKYLTNETKIYIFIPRIPRGVYIIFLGFFKNVIFPTSGRYLQRSALKLEDSGFLKTLYYLSSWMKIVVSVNVCSNYVSFIDC